MRRLLSCCLCWSVLAGNLVYPAESATGAKSGLIGEQRCRQIPAPDSGVKLLEDIFQRIGKDPMLLIKMDSTSYQTTGPASISKGPTDYELAIKPKEGAGDIPPVDSARRYDHNLNRFWDQDRGGSRDQQTPGVWERSESPLRPTIHKGLWERNGITFLHTGIREYSALFPSSGGLPSLSLGLPEQEVVRSLAVLGKVRRRSIKGWGILTCTTAGAKSATLQVYLRHGTVRAVRIFDPVFPGIHMAIQPGDDLIALKYCLGEPSFIVAEPAQGLGQNYVYPMNQVAFLLARGQNAPVPSITSTLIFSANMER